MTNSIESVSLDVGSHADLITGLVATTYIRTERVDRAMSKVDRIDFMPPGIFPVQVYRDFKYKIGYGAEIDQPYMHAYSLSMLEKYLKPGIKVLDIGCGSGYMIPCLLDMMDYKGQVIGIDHIPQLIDFSLQNIRKNFSEYIDNGQIELYTWDGRKGFPHKAPYDIIYIGAALVKPPKKMIEQLKIGGVIFMTQSPLQRYGKFKLFEKISETKLNETEGLPNMSFHLTDKTDQLITQV